MISNTGLQHQSVPRRPGNSRWATTAVAIVLAPLSCDKQKSDIVEVSPYPPGFAVAVAPALNFSGSPDVDPVKVADALASELGSMAGLNVLPVNRVMAVLAREGKWQIESPAH